MVLSAMRRPKLTFLDSRTIGVILYRSMRKFDCSVSNWWDRFMLIITNIFWSSKFTFINFEHYKCGLFYIILIIHTSFLFYFFLAIIWDYIQTFLSGYTLIESAYWCITFLTEVTWIASLINVYPAHVVLLCRCKSERITILRYAKIL